MIFSRVFCCLLKGLSERAHGVVGVRFIENIWLPKLKGFKAHTYLYMQNCFSQIVQFRLFSCPLQRQTSKPTSLFNRSYLVKFEQIKVKKFSDQAQLGTFTAQRFFLGGGVGGGINRNFSLWRHICYHKCRHCCELFSGNFRPYLMFTTKSLYFERQYLTNEWLLVKVYVQSTWLSVWLFPSPCCGVWSSRVRWMSSTTQFRCCVKRLSSRSWNSENERSCFPVSTVHVSTKIFWYLNTLYLFSYRMENSRV